MHWKWKGNGSIFGQAKDVNKSSAKGRCRKERGYTVVNYFNSIN